MTEDTLRGRAVDTYMDTGHVATLRFDCLSAVRLKSKGYIDAPRLVGSEAA